jgi:[ribosomal protein S5]-alanine N-acetyltransferase
MPAPDTIVTKRLILRRVEERDAAAIARLANDPEISLRVGSIRYPYTGRDLRLFYARACRPLAAGELGTYVIAAKGNSRLVIGVAGLNHRRRNGDTCVSYVSYWIGRPFRRRGFAFEASQVLVNYAFSVLDTARIDISCLLGNCGSQRVIEKLGARFTGRSVARSALLRRNAVLLKYMLERSAWQRSPQFGG